MPRGEYFRIEPRDRRPLTPSDEVVLHARIAAGDVSARNELIERALPFLVLRVARWKRFVPVDDAVSLVVVEIISNLHKWDPGRGRFLTWAPLMVRTAICRHIEVESRRGRPSDPGRAAFFELLRDRREPDPAAEADRRDLASKVHRTLRRLGPDRPESKAFVAKYTGDATLRAIGDELGVSRQRAAQLAERAEKRFREEWDRRSSPTAKGVA